MNHTTRPALPRCEYAHSPGHRCDLLSEHQGEHHWIRYVGAAAYVHQYTAADPVPAKSA